MWSVLPFLYVFITWQQLDLRIITHSCRGSYCCLPKWHRPSPWIPGDGFLRMCSVSFKIILLRIKRDTQISLSSGSTLTEGYSMDHRCSWASWLHTLVDGEVFSVLCYSSEEPWAESRGSEDVVMLGWHQTKPSWSCFTHSCGWNQKWDWENPRQAIRAPDKETKWGMGDKRCYPSRAMVPMRLRRSLKQSKVVDAVLSSQGP